MFAFDRSAFAVLLPLALLFAVVLWSNREAPVATHPASEQVASADVHGGRGQEQGACPDAPGTQTLAANFPSR